MDDYYNLEFSFSDISMCESGGEFEVLDKLMNDEIPQNKWCIITKLYINSNLGTCEFELQCDYSKNIYILEYSSSIEDVFCNPDIPGLSRWAQEKGWNIPQPSEFVAKSNKEFWKHFYDTNVIDCNYFDKVYGKRESEW